ncbi:MAG: 23S rRNA (guanosine2251-2'-O)-methyltransferase [Parcubacteria bacterium C7867-001]|nr:MAG: 23S rRNA (guanosine2251-2'-O)-methyltransferase [Parcubacteria bacterium C7867-001]
MPKPLEKAYIYGKNALMEALESAPQVIKRVHLSPDVSDAALRSKLKQRGIPVSELKAGEANRKVGDDKTHQGVIAVVDTGLLVRSFDDFIRELTPTKATALAVLGEVQDPHNVGAIIRSAAAFGLAGVLIPEHNQAQVTGTVVKTSAGMAFRIPLVSIGNVNTTLRTLKDKGFWIYGLAMDGEQIQNENFDAPAVFVFGNEGDGIREKTLETCDITLSIPMHPRTESLNVAVSAGIVFHAWSGKHPHALRA